MQAPILGQHAPEFMKLFLSPLKQKLFLLSKLPAAWFMGVKMKTLTPERSIVHLPFSWYSKNPFKSTYFAAQAAAAELSTGILANMQLYKGPKMSMLVTGMRAEYFKKVNKTARFVCEQGQDIKACMQKAIDTGEGQRIEIISEGYMTGPDGQDILVSRFYFEWSFKAK
ncbi:hypothetical protein SapgrDRAFT_0565 [Saprospira grandis DSM 2844]|uniref:Thioesterase n=1 Tax=Saprospira grandis DSM 2844 TaxID=694433 RepID=J1I202_9BACT|nr:DUF4442 domain-containing protein [Saprospira grandis]EJF52308.1 hypothetical protein SapgrDRAFT_0565 [Saprospira grandis DSM 2844]